MRTEELDHEIVGSEFPVVLEKNYDYGSGVNAPSGRFVSSKRQIEQYPDGCPVCGYDRVEVAILTTPGVHQVKCRACRHDITDPDNPTPEYDHEEKIRENDELLYRSTHGSVEVYDHPTASFIQIISNGRTVAVDYDDLRRVVERL